MKNRELSYCGLFGAAALLLPVLFHLFHLGHIFMPMYLPLVALAFFVSPGMSALTSFIVPLLSGSVTGMPPFYPPVAPVMSAELAIMSLMIGTLHRLMPRINTSVVLVPTLITGRIISAGLMYLAARSMGLPSAFIAGLSFFSGWPGVVLMMIAVPTIVRLANPQTVKKGLHEN